MATIVTKPKSGQALLSVLSAAGALGVLAIVFATAPAIMKRSMGAAAGEASNQSLGLLLNQMKGFPEVCNQIGGLNVPAPGVPSSLASLRFGNTLLMAGATFLELRILSMTMDQMAPPTAYSSPKAMVRIRVDSQRIGGTETYSSEVVIPVNVTGTTIGNCLSMTIAVGGSVFNARTACEEMGGIWRDLFTPSNVAVTACDPSSPEFGDAEGCPIGDGNNGTPLGAKYAFDVNLPVGVYDPSNPALLGACDLVAGLCKALGARVSKIVPPDPVYGLPFPSSGNPTLYCDAASCVPTGGAGVPANFYWGFALACSGKDWNAAHFQQLAADGGCAAGSYVTGFAQDGTIRCATMTAGATGTCTNSGSCLRPAILPGRCATHTLGGTPAAAFHKITNGLVESVVCSDEAEAYLGGNFAAGLLPRCHTDPGVLEERCP